MTVQELLNRINRMVLEDPSILDADVEMNGPHPYCALLYVDKHVGPHPGFLRTDKTTVYLSGGS